MGRTSETFLYGCLNRFRKPHYPASINTQLWPALPRNTTFTMAGLR